MDQIKSQPPEQVLTCLRKPAVNREETLGALTKSIILSAGPEKFTACIFFSFLFFLVTCWTNAPRQHLPSIGNQLWNGLRCLFFKLPKQIEIQGRTDTLRPHWRRTQSRRQAKRSSWQRRGPGKLSALGLQAEASPPDLPHWRP